MKLPGPAALWYRFNEFLSSWQLTLESKGWSEEQIARQEASEFLDMIADWRRWNPPDLATYT